ncbi:hypothetical protein A2313_04870 [Candidatus Roizmanbacteria bacterium RIFOXYB2_FULL_41_10]|uniref:Uncharacterized protein n=1 Tax=Candidatus Roizmanbacteria bacterium RIFOXYA1_FULL_41_12 TaxID=1802082 RepID=A0A1F7K9F6_9BACT|nr:MAG: hypothetical protein A2209_02260 [Candidatus Roizmanbacteria bacterium RIFOXYA1_FULL_41_12]OGK67280.1 MAG: hypothetical protein A2262_04105 [Candidatus Roizmanbacteria bacterium RIFOXYA2_FULL_41_8]OGK68026.1 MAG: hypothetical protein A2377_03995 [Candidatus Roizmanbacteria bacterium RIFOXYB1_FULL_41_27]OGK69180.1 MAG: hypothetical protein A2313_04870 [Candidatus Roizmanbacteria bacterium RIFOXYB2_FULL_41_10]OGK72226.1 MAG: hypothetical protein A2403_04685 [Candidatus Roizmanbacteria bac
MDIRLPDITKLTWPLNVALIGSIFSIFALIFNPQFIYYGFITFLYGILCHLVDVSYNFWLKKEKWNPSFVFISQFVLSVLWVFVVLYTYDKIPTIFNWEFEFFSIFSWQELLIGALLGWVLSFLSVWTIDKLKEPNLIFEIGSIADKHPTYKWKFVHIRVKNCKKLPKINPFTPSPAFECKAIIKIEDKVFIGRWTSKEQPIGNNPGDIVNKAFVHPRETIHPFTSDHESVEVVIGLKYEGEDNFYRFNNENYLYEQNGYKNKEWEFPKGTYDGEIEISTLGQIYKQPFKVMNKSNKRDDFWLELVDYSN